MKANFKTRVTGMVMAAVGIAAFGVALPATASAHATCSYHREFDKVALGWRYNIPQDVQNFPAQRYKVCRVITTVDGAFSGKHIIGDRRIIQYY